MKAFVSERQQQHHHQQQQQQLLYQRQIRQYQENEHRRWIAVKAGKHFSHESSK